MKSKHNTHYIVATHASRTAGKDEINGPSHTLFEQFKIENIPAMLISHPLNLMDYETKVFDFDQDETIKITTHTTPAFLPSICRYILEIALNVWLTLKETRGGNRVVYIGIDPLNALGGILVRIISRNVVTIFYSVDYTENRFENRYLNLAYHTIESFCVSHSNYFWAVSSRIVDKIGPNDIEKKSLVVPNSPTVSINPDLAQNYNGNLNCIMAGYLNKYINYSLAIEATAILAKSHPRIRLLIAGEGEEKATYMALAKELGVENNVEFLGHIDHTKLLQAYENCFLGLALYSGKGSWNKYGDSMKAREYMAKGLPVIITKIPSTADDIARYGSGVVLDTDTPEELSLYIDKCIVDMDYYLKLRINSIKCAQAYDKSTIISRVISKFNNDY